MDENVRESILNSVKLYVGYTADYTPFDEELIMLINSNLRKLNQLGCGVPRFEISGPDEKWSDFLDDENTAAMAKEYVKTSVKLAHDPPQNSFLVNLLQEQLKEVGWRINQDAETPVD